MSRDHRDHLRFAPYLRDFMLDFLRFCDARGDDWEAGA